MSDDPSAGPRKGGGGLLLNMARRLRGTAQAPLAGEVSSFGLTGPDTLIARGELKAMIERKRRNDFVRKREFDALRRLRREGPTAVGPATLEPSSMLDDSVLPWLSEARRRAEQEVRAKIDAIERQMSAEALPGAPRPGDWEGRQTEPPPLPPRRPAGRPAGRRRFESTTLVPDPWPALPERAAAEGATGREPGLEAAAFAFARGAVEAAEQALRARIAPGAAQAEEPEAWRALADLLRALGRGPAFDALVLEFQARFAGPPPRWQRPQPLIPAEGWLRLDGVQQAPLAERLAQPELLALRRGTLLLDCRELQRIEPAAAAELLHWVLQRRAAGCQLRIEQPHRLIVPLLQAIGLPAHAALQLRED
ncbi:STAS domain-containing protein [Piscinibacter sp. Jin2]|uniref:STAS domain-containing protein n=1 Tax=Aquariibacter lacus TaxID=2801332 RepID=A0A9X1BQ21_9BURK|nr:STAS domain-containing protein [Piscinibacter lacus]MBL0718324.1 STAS domain-containing protein [Piscinibacter lacus]